MPDEPSDADIVKPDRFDIRAELLILRQEHRDLDDATNALVASGRTNPLQIQRLKKKKLLLRDRIQALEDRLLPDIIA